jgi:hypothetical protein
MKISLIENGLDSLKKGYDHLRKYEDQKEAGAKDVDRFSSLKDTILSVQHGIEILFKFLLKENNEVLLFSTVDGKLKEAFKKRRAGEITELFEVDGLHTVTFKESIERVSDICGVTVDEKFRKVLLKVEIWRNSIIHSAVVLNEDEVSNVLLKLMKDLDVFFGQAIGDQYLNGQGRHELDRAYRLFIASRGMHQNSIKAKVVERLIVALTENNIKKVTSPGVFMIEDAQTAYSILQKMQGDGIVYGCDMKNLHCSGKTLITNLSSTNVMTIFCEDNNTDYQLQFGGILVYVPAVGDSASPLIFAYSAGLKETGWSPIIHENDGFKTQAGIFLLDERTYVWDEIHYREFYNQEDSSDFSRDARGVVRFLSKGCACFLNVQTLEYGKADDFMHSNQFDDINRLYQVFSDYILTLI